MFDEILPLKPDLSVEDLRKKPRAFLPPNSNAPYWKKMISAPPRNDLGSPDPPYKTDDIGGKNAYVYIIDDGFDIVARLGAVG